MARQNQGTIAIASLPLKKMCRFVIYSFPSIKIFNLHASEQKKSVSGVKLCDKLNIALHKIDIFNNQCEMKATMNMK